MRSKAFGTFLFFIGLIGAFILGRHFAHTSPEILGRVDRSEVETGSASRTSPEPSRNPSEPDEEISETEELEEPAFNPFASVLDQEGHLIPLPDFRAQLLLRDPLLESNANFRRESLRVYLERVALLENTEEVFLLDAEIIGSADREVLAGFLIHASKYGVDYLREVSGRLGVEWSSAFASADAIDRLPASDVDYTFQLLADKDALERPNLEKWVERLFPPDSEIDWEAKLNLLQSPALLAMREEAASRFGAALSGIDDFNAVERVLVAIESPALRMTIANAFALQSLAENPAQALVFLEELKSRRIPIPEIPAEPLIRAGMQLAAESGDAALRKIERVESERQREALTRGYLKLKADLDPSGTALEVINEGTRALTEEQYAGRLAEIMDSWLGINTEEAIGFMERSNLPEEAEAVILKKNVGRLMSFSPEKAEKFITSRSDTVKEAVASEYIDRISEIAPEKALDFIKNIKDPGTKSFELSRFGLKMASYDVQLAVDFASRSADPDARDALLSGIVSGIGTKDPTYAYRLSEYINRESTRDHTLMNLHELMKMTDPDSAAFLRSELPTPGN